jgi:hypothetical protein
VILEKFLELAHLVKLLWEQSKIKRKSKYSRKRKIGPGRKHKLSFERSRITKKRSKAHCYGVCVCLFQEIPHSQKSIAQSDRSV